MTNIFDKEEIENIAKNSFSGPIEADKIALAAIKEFQIRDTDIFLIGYPKSGTTWAQEMMWIIANDFDFEGAKVFIDERFPILEMCAFQTKQNNSSKNNLECHWNSLQYAAKLKSPRLIKAHFPPSMIPEQLLTGEKKAKIIYIARNVKDVCLSYYHHLKLMKVLNNNCSLDDFCKMFIAGCRPLLPYWESILYFWEHRNEKHILFIKYEEMKSDLSEVIRKVANFLNKPLTKEHEVMLMEWLNFDSMKSNVAVNHDNLYEQSGLFIRVGKVGEHKKEMSAEILSKFDMWIEASLRGSDYKM